MVSNMMENITLYICYLYIYIYLGGLGSKVQNQQQGFEDVETMPCWAC